MPVTFVSSSSAANSSGASTITVPTPAGVVAGNLLVTIIYGATSSQSPAYAPPAGWDTTGTSASGMGTYPAGSVTSGSGGCAVFVRAATGQEPASYTFTGPAWLSAVMLQYSGTSGLDGTPRLTVSSGSTATTPAATAGAAGSVPVVFCGSWIGNAWTTPIGATVRQTVRSAGNTSTYTFEGTPVTAAGPAPTYASTQTNAQNYATGTILLAQSASAPNPAASAIRVGAATPDTYRVGVTTPTAIYAGTTLIWGTTTASAGVTNQPAQPASVHYGNPPTGADAYAHPGGLVIASRDQYDHQLFKDVSTGGGTVLIYLDAIIDNPTGRYHDLLDNPSVYGPAVPRWPGNYQANEWGYLNDFRPGGILQSKLEPVLELMVTENPHMGGWFLDDVGSRSWFPDIDWAAFPDKAEYRAGAVELCQTTRTVADRHGLIFMVNGTWAAGPANGGGYPDVNTHGLSLADGGFVEHHDGEIGYWGAAYGQTGTQWATESPITNGEAFHFATMNTAAGLDEFANSGSFAYVSQQTEYSGAAPWGPFHPTGLPSKVGG